MILLTSSLSSILNIEVTLNKLDQTYVSNCRSYPQPRGEIGQKMWTRHKEVLAETYVAELTLYYAINFFNLFVLIGQVSVTIT